MGLGPGSSDYLAPIAKRAITEADVIIGYKGYIKLIDKVMLKGKDLFSTGMHGEVERCEEAIRSSLNGKRTVLISSGDPGIYGMAGLVLELIAEKGFSDRIKPQIIPGIPALSAGAALLGAPLMHDFAVVSLSDLLTPWELIKKRIVAALTANFVLVIYNPRSKKRNWQLRSVLDLTIKIRGADTLVGVVKNAAREGESVTIGTVQDIDDSMIDMLSIIFVGNSDTKLFPGQIVTPRGYPLNR